MGPDARKKWLCVGGVLLVTGVVGALAFHHWVDGVDLGALASQKAKSELGVDLKIGAVAWTVWPSPGASLSDVSVRSKFAGKEVEMARMGSARARLSWPALLRGSLELESIAFKDGAVSMDLDAKGASAWSQAMDAAKSKQAKPDGVGVGAGGDPIASLARITLSEVGFSYHRQGSMARSAMVEQLTAKKSGLGWEWSSALLVGQEKIEHEGALSQSDGAGRLDAKLKAQGWEAKAMVLGKSAHAYGVDFEGAGADLSSLGRSLGQPSISGDGKLRMHADFDQGKWSSKVSELKMGPWSASGSFELDGAGKVPKLRFNAAAVHALHAEPDREAPGSGSQDAAIPWTALTGLDASGHASIEWVVGSDSKFASFDAKMGSGALELSKIKGRAFGGEFSGSASADAKSRSAQASLAFGGASLEALLSKAGSAGAVHGGPLTARADLRASGSKVSEMRSSLSGSASAQVGHLSVASGSAGGLASLMGSQLPWAKQAGGFMELDCVGARMSLAGGVGRGSPIVGVEGPALSATGSGSVDFASGTLDLGLEVKPKGGLDIANISTLASAMRLSGPWGSPHVSVDPGRAGASIATIGAAISTGGFSLLAGALAKKADQGPGACAIALGAAPGAPSSAPAARASASNPIAAGIEKLRGLFGK